MRAGKLRTLAGGMACLALASAGLIGATGAAAASPPALTSAARSWVSDAPPSAGVPSVSFDAHPAASRRYWTRARMEAARPVEGVGPSAHGSKLNPILTPTSETIADPTLPQYRVN